METPVDPSRIREMEDIREAIEKLFSGKRVKVYIFGGFLSEEDIGYELFLLREVLEESNLPFFVDLSKTGKDFREAVLKEGKLWINLESN